MSRSPIKYKIHGLDSVQGVIRSANNNVFYDTLEEAIEQAKIYLANPRNDNCSGYVIMKTHTIIKRAQAPIERFEVGADDVIYEVG